MDVNWVEKVPVNGVTSFVAVLTTLPITVKLIVELVGVKFEKLKADGGSGWKKVGEQF